MSKHYDVVVLGAGIGALSIAALLARRSWRVLVLGQGFRPAHYTFDGLSLARRPFTFLAGGTPVWRRILVELAQSQMFRRRARSPDPMLQIFEPRQRTSIPTDEALLAREIDREFPEVRRVVDELNAEVARANAAADLAIDDDVVWSPGTFWERRETARAAAGLPYRRERERDLLAEFPRGHAFRDLVEVPASFASDLGTRLPPFALARLHRAWTHRLLELERGEDDLVDFLVERVRAHGGEALLSGQASQIVVRSGRVTGIRFDGDDEATGVQFVVTDLTSSALLDLASEYRPSRRALDARPRVEVESQRFVTSLVVRDEGLPAPLAHEAFLLPGTHGDQPLVHVQKSPIGSAMPGLTLLVAEARVLPSHAFDSRERSRVRAAIVASIERYLPYIERHYVLIDSPHDGLPLWDYRSGARALVDRAALRSGGGSVDAEAMRPLFRVDDAAGASLDGLGGEPMRFPLAGTFGVGQSILPQLGQEGELLAAWGGARVITRTDRRKEKMRREMWSKVELG